MKNLILLIILFYWSSLFSQTGLITVNETTIFEVATNPQGGVATKSKQGSLALNNEGLGSVFANIGSGDRDWDLISSTSPSSLVYYYDFIPTLSPEFTSTVAGGSSSCQTSTTGVNSTNRALGVFNCDTGTSATGRASFLHGTNSLLFGYANLRYKTRMNLNLLSTITQRYTMYLGFLDTTAAGDQVDGAYFRYNDNVNTGKWECVTANNSTRTAVDSGITTTTGWNIFEVNVNEAGTSATYYINGTLVCTIATNIPTGTGRNFSSGYKIEKSIGGTQSDFFTDWFKLQIIYSSTR